jgi:phosphatidylserine/phosphatidylglycerophosphate/cardiolipin synthase-like enzyme
MRTRLAALITILTLLTACTSFRFPVSPTATVTPLGGAQNVRLFVYPDDDEQALIDKIAAARQRVLMKMYLLTDTRIIDALVAARQNGAVVQALVEEHPFGGGAAAGQAAYDKLKAAKITTRYTNPAFRFTHEKSFVIDNDAIILTANMTQAAFARNRELGIITTNPDDVAQVVAAFQADWDRTAFQSASHDLVWSPENARLRINSLINSATRLLIVYAEEAQDDEQAQLLVDAVARGVDVRFLISPPGNSDGSDGNAPDLDQMQSGGVKVRYLKNPYIHAKMFVADGVFGFVGSQNISTSSLEFNRELGILLSDHTALERLADTFNADWDKAIDR